MAAVVSEMERLQLHRPWCGKEAAERLRISMGVSTSDVELYRVGGGEPMTGTLPRILPGARLHHAHRVPPRPLSIGQAHSARIPLRQSKRKLSHG